MIPMGDLGTWIGGKIEDGEWRIATKRRRGAEEGGSRIEEIEPRDGGMRWVRWRDKKLGKTGERWLRSAIALFGRETGMCVLNFGQFRTFSDGGDERTGAE